MNIHTIIGRLTRDPEFTPRKNSDASDRVNFTVAVDAKFGDETYFYDCVAFGGLAGVIDKYCTKGMLVGVSGEGQYRGYTAKDGSKRKSYSIKVDDFKFCSSKSDGQKSAQGQTTDNFTEQAEDIPF